MLKGIVLFFLFWVGVQAERGIAVYWGQNSDGNQQRLRYYCDKPSIDVVVLSFVTNLPDLEINFSNMCGAQFSSGLLNCPEIGQDIEYCQNRGKIILLSVGGAVGDYAFNSEKDAKRAADVLWNAFGESSQPSERPFGRALVNGFDLDLEVPSKHYVAFVKRLRKHTDSVKRYYFLSAAPQCPFPDASVGEILANVPLDFVFIQFYNNYCGLNGNYFNFASHWLEFAEKGAINKETHMFIGLPGSPGSAGSGYVDYDTIVQTITPEMFHHERFSGFMLWDASSADNNKDAQGISFDEQLKKYLQ